MRKPRVLVTGASGFTGHYVCTALIKEGYEPLALTEDGSLSGKSIDLCDREALRIFIAKYRPESVIHLAAIAFVDHGNSSDFYRVNVIGTLNLLEQLEINNCITGKVILASSANIYGNRYPNETISEDFHAEPLNDYAVSKYSMELMAKLHQKTLPIDIVRPFNYTGVGQSKQFLIPKIVDAFVNKHKTITLGNLDVYRDFSDVRDIADYYTQVLKMPTSGDTYNFCSGKLVGITDIIKICESLAGYKIKVMSSQRFQRNTELRSLLGDRRKIDKLVSNLLPKNIEETIKWMFEDRSLGN